MEWSDTRPCSATLPCRTAVSSQTAPLGPPEPRARLPVRDRCCVTNLIKVTTFLSRREHAAVNTAVRKQILGDHRPALTVIVTGIWDPARLVEIEAVAAA